mmetsp:Transcript_26699/g.30821  ORF Transcript_26699/g.30821 Transcript_26699/m.30821 type:complete len:206 (+) Transcript_26699:719-1336(+)
MVDRSAHIRLVSGSVKIAPVRNNHHFRPCRHPIFLKIRFPTIFANRNANSDPTPTRQQQDIRYSRKILDVLLVIGIICRYDVPLIGCQVLQCFYPFFPFFLPRITIISAIEAPINPCVVSTELKSCCSMDNDRTIKRQKQLAVGYRVVTKEGIHAFKFWVVFVGRFEVNNLLFCRVKFLPMICPNDFQSVPTKAVIVTDTIDFCM